MDMRGFSIEKIEDIELIGGRRVGRVTVHLSFFDETTDAFSNLTITLPLTYERTETINAVRDRAYRKASELASGAARLLAESSLLDLQQRADALPDHLRLGLEAPETPA